jgi:hypothetical protein
MLFYSAHTASTAKSKQSFIYSHFSFNPLLTKDLPCGILANALPGRRELINHKPKFFYYVLN